MSCTENAKVNCDEVLDQVFEYLHGELDEAAKARVKSHLDECSPCFEEYGIEREVRQLVYRSCRCQHAPDRLRQQVLARITSMRLSVAMSGGDVESRASAQVAGFSVSVEVESGEDRI